MASKQYLFAPGPTPVPPQVLAAMAEPMVHHRGADFRVVYERTLARLQQVFRTEQEVLLFAASGTGAMESAFANLISPGDRVLVVTAGSFGDRWNAIAKAYGADIDSLAYEWGETASADDVAARLAANPAKAVFMTQSETSTGVVHDVRALAAAAAEGGALSVVDAISSLGAVPLEMDAWGVDVVVSGSQKALMTPPGLAMVSVSEQAWGKLGTGPRFYFDWEKTKAAQEKFDAAFTPAVSLINGLDVALGMLLENGLEDAFAHHARLGRAAREGVKAMGLELFSPDEERSAVVTAVRAPEGIDSDDVLKLLRTRWGVTLAPGQGKLKGKIFRIGHIGWYDIFDITTALAAVELALDELGAEIERGAAVTRALEAYAESVRA
jgi:aspartate aminotransferase-like enzyme